jgi:hypothetical protein
MIGFFLTFFVVVVAFVVVGWRQGRPNRCPDYELIHDLEFELGFREDPRKGTTDCLYHRPPRSIPGVENIARPTPSQQVMWGTASADMVEITNWGDMQRRYVQGINDIANGDIGGMSTEREWR